MKTPLVKMSQLRLGSLHHGELGLRNPPSTMLAPGRAMLLFPHPVLQGARPAEGLVVIPQQGLSAARNSARRLGSPPGGAASKDLIYQTACEPVG